MFSGDWIWMVRGLSVCMMMGTLSRSLDPHTLRHSGTHTLTHSSIPPATTHPELRT